MKLDDFDFYLPQNLIAQQPTSKREESRLLIVDKKTEELTHSTFKHLTQCLQKNDLLVMNNSKTMHARLLAQKLSGGSVEILIDKIESTDTAKVIVGCNRKPAIGSFLIIQNHKAKVLDRDGRWFYLQFEIPVLEIMSLYGILPLPPYIKRTADEKDNERYQTVYANSLGSVATPTAGLHFSEKMIEQIKEKGVDIGFLTLHVGSGTFQKIKTDDFENYKMHEEYIQINQDLCNKITDCHSNGGRVIAVGTTSTRALETMMKTNNGKITPYEGYSSLFLYPSSEFKLIDGLITNFHLPKSSLFILVSAFLGLELVKKSYDEAISKSYRFFSYGDATFLMNQKRTNTPTQ